MKAINVKNVKEQSAFCMELMRRLDKEIRDDVDDSAWGGIWYHARKREDIVRLRRELSKLHKLLTPFSEPWSEM